MNKQNDSSNDESSMNSSGSIQIKSIRDEVTTECYFESYPADYLTKLTSEISKTSAFANNMKSLPSASLIAFLYIQENITLTLRPERESNSFGDNNEEYCYWIAPEKHENFVITLLKQKIIEEGILRNFAATIEKRIPEIASKFQKLSYHELNTIRTTVVEISQDYWYWKSKGIVDKYLLLANAINNFLILSTSQNSKNKMGNAKSTINTLIRTFDIGKKNILKVDKPKDLTLIIDISFADGKRHEEVTLVASKERRVINKLFTKNEIEFIISLVEAYKKISISIQNDKGVEVKIAPGTVLVSRQPVPLPSQKPIMRTEDNNGGEISPLGNDLNRIIRLDRQKKPKSGDYTYIIGTRIRKHLANSQNRFTVFSKKNNSLITNINIIVDSRPRGIRFNRSR